MKEWKEVQVLFEENKSPEEICGIRTKYAMAWYIRKANKNKRLYYWFSFIGMICPLINVVSAACWDNNIIIVVLSSITSLAASLLALTNARVKWENYRSAAEFLKREYTLFQGRVGLYGEDQRVSVYLNVIEEFMGKVHANWQKYFDENKPAKRADEKDIKEFG